MSSSAYGKIIVGKVLEITAEKVNLSKTRYDIDTAKPFEFEYEALDIKVKVGDATFTLPPDDKIFKDVSPNGWNPSWESWKFDRIQHRMYEWLTAKGIPHYDEASGKFAYFHYYGDYIIGREVVAMDGHEETAEIELPEIADLIPKVAAELHGIFGIIIKPKVILSVHLG